VSSLADVPRTVLGRRCHRVRVQDAAVYTAERSITLVGASLCTQLQGLVRILAASSLGTRITQLAALASAPSPFLSCSGGYFASSGS